jgi:hypothetical protein
MLVAAFNLYWYCAFLSFPLFGEDAAALYSNLLETLKDGHVATLRFPIKWLEGLGQPNLFVTITFDPFSWLMALPFDSADAFRLSMAARATVGWLAAYWFAVTLFRGRRTIALFSATVYLLINFILMNAWGIHTFAGMYNATHAAIFPLLLTLALRVMRSSHWLVWEDAALLVALLFFLLDYPIGSLMGMTMFLLFAALVVFVTRPAGRRKTARRFVKIAAMTALLLLAPPLDVLSSWSALLANSARTVFSDELFAYGYEYIPPVMWAQTSWALRLCVLLSLSAVLYLRRWPRPLSLAAGALALIVGGVQVMALVKYLGFASVLVDRLPRVQFFEFYATPYYAVCAGFAVYYWRELLFPRTEGWQRWRDRAVRLAPLLAIAFLLLPVAATVLLAYAVLDALARLRGEPATSAWMEKRHAQLLAAWGGALALFACAIGAWLPPTSEIYPIFFTAARCRVGAIWCGDTPGPTLAVSDNPLTAFLRNELGAGARFAGRAETLVRPAAVFERAPAGEVRWSPALFARLHNWYERAYEAQRIKYSPVDNPEWLPPFDFGWEERYPLLRALDKIAHNDLPYYGPSQEELVVAMHDWYTQHGREAGLVALDYMDPWRSVASIRAVVDERDGAYFATGNGLLQRALSFQGVPVASAYEQALDYLYYLFWTRYVSAGQRAKKSINLTSLETFNADRLALAGVRYLIARDSEVYEPLPLSRVTSWHGYSIYAIPDANVGGYAVDRLLFGDSLTDELRLMRMHDFDPRRTAVLSAESRAESPAVAPLAPIVRSSVALAPNELTFTAANTGGTSLVVLPFNWSHCWRAEWRKGSGRLLRADVDLIAVTFAGEVELRLSSDAGYGAGRACLRDDRALVGQATRAAREIDPGETYEPISEKTPPFSATRLRFAADQVEESALEQSRIYGSGDGIVVPSSLRPLLSRGSMEHGLSPAHDIRLLHEGDGYAISAQNAGGDSLAALPIRYSSCWQASWQGPEGALVPVDTSWLGILFHGAAAVELRLPEEIGQAKCREDDLARKTLAALLKKDPTATTVGHYKLSDTIDFRQYGGSESVTANGWWEPEPWGRWTVGKRARIVLRLTTSPRSDVVIAATAGALLAPARPLVTAGVRVNGTEVGTWEFQLGQSPGRRMVVVPRALIGDTRVMIIDFEVGSVASPEELRISNDARPLALSFETLGVTEKHGP